MPKKTGGVREISAPLLHPKQARYPNIVGANYVAMVNPAKGQEFLVQL
ncbi:MULTISPECIES: hypothetical protein [unclassified Chamaesiphon]|nr:MULTISPECIES: hypothetical protein [unclassified Chamaesiphon]